MALNSNFRTLTADNIEGIVDEKNYLRSSFENGTLSGWREMAVTLDASGFPNAIPTIGTDVSPNAASSLSLSATSTTPLSGARSLLVTVPTSLSQGQGFISEEFTLDRMDLGKVLTVSFDYERVSGTYNFSGTRGSQTWMVYVYDATAGGANWIQPAGFLGMNQSSNPGRVSCTFQSSVTAGQKYRIAVIAHQAASGASTISFDNFTCSRQTAPIGPVVTDWVSYTPTFTSWGTVSNVSVYSRRVGDSLEVEGRFTAGTTAAATAFMTLGFNGVNGNVTVDGAKLNGFYVVGSGAGQFSSATWFSSFKITTSGGAPSVGFGVESSTTPGYSGSFGTSFGNNGVYSFYFKVPITGWSSNVQLSDSTDTRVVAATAFLPSTTGSFNAESQIVGFSTINDTHGAFNGSTYSIPVSGFYCVSFTYFTSTYTGSTAPAIRINGGASIYGNDSAVTGNSARRNITITRYFNAGDSIAFWVFTNASVSLVAGSTNTYLSVNRLSGPSVVAASEVVEATYGSSAGNVMNNATEMWLDFPTKVRDTHNAVSGAGTGNKTTFNNGWKFTAPVTGRYYVNAVWHIQSASVANSVAYGYIAVNGAGQSHSDIKAGQNPVGDAFGVQINGEVFLNAGDYVEIVGYQANGANRNQQASSLRNRVQIVKVGNY